MSYKSLATMITEGKVVQATCPRCRGNVTIPTEVRQTKLPGGMFQPLGQCHRCGVGYSWHSKDNPVGGTAILREDIGKTDVWFCDRVLDAPAPKILEG